MDGKRGEKTKPAAKRRHGSTTFFVTVDYLFLLIFFCFLGYILFQIWPQSALVSTK